MLDVKIKLLNPKAQIPVYVHKGDSGVDLRTMISANLNPGDKILLPTGIAVQFPEGYEAQIRSRSGLALKQCLAVLNQPGTIDFGFSAEIKVILFNFGQHVQQIQEGERIAQMVFAPVIQAQFAIVDEFEETSRGEGGFGSTGTR